MKDIIKKSFLLGLGAATLTKNQAEKIIKELVKKNAMTVKDGREMLKRARKVAKSESTRVAKLVEKEAKRVAGKLASTSQIKKVRKKLKSIDKELSSKGKKTLNKIMKELSK